MRKALIDLRDDTSDDEQASFELARSARRFSRRTKEEVDDKLSFSAVLVRAGEIDAANRLIEELEQDVRAEEAALMEQVNEVRIARTMRRDRVTRARLARVLVTAVVGAGMMAFSAIGMAVAGMFGESDRSARVAPGLISDAGVRAGGEPSSFRLADQLRKRMRKVKIADAEMLLSAAQARMLEKITTGAVGSDQLEQLLRELQLPPGLTAEVRKLLTATVAAATTPPAPAPAVPAPSAADPAKKKAKKKVEKHRDEGAPADPDPKPSPPQPSPEPSPTPSSGGDDGGDSAGGDDRGSAGPGVPSPF